VQTILQDALHDKTSLQCERASRFVLAAPHPALVLSDSLSTYRKQPYGVSGNRTIPTSQTPGDVFLLCDLTELIEFFRKTLRAEHLLEMLEFVAHGTTPVVLGVSRGVDLNFGIDTRKTAAGESETGCP